VSNVGQVVVEELVVEELAVPLLLTALTAKLNL
jgi:hypothetical protein